MYYMKSKRVISEEKKGQEALVDSSIKATDEQVKGIISRALVSVHQNNSRKEVMDAEWERWGKLCEDVVVDVDPPKATVEYNSGLMLIVKREGNGVVLFMEWIYKFNGGRIEKVIMNQEDAVKFRFNGLRSSFEDARDYINANL